jgi:hypothetical protein
MSYEPTPELELRAAEQRKALHTTVVELKSMVKEKTDVHRLASEYALPVSGVAALAGLVLGYGVTGIFTRH